MSKFNAIGILRSTWRTIPRPLRHGMMKLIRPVAWYTYGKTRCARGITPGSDQTVSSPLVVAGLFETANGIGEAARLTFQSLQASNLKPIAVSLSQHIPAQRISTSIPLSSMPDESAGTLILQMNAPETIFALHHLKMFRDRNWRIIGYWAWELSAFPKYWDQAFPYLSEIWAISEFTAKSLAQHPKSPPIHVVNHPISSIKPIKPDRPKFKLKQDEFVFLTMADSLSSMQRKNPFSTIAAFKKAFSSDESAKLIIKTRNLKTGSKAHTDLLIAIGDSSNITLLDTELSDDERWVLFHSVDALISLHRAEGFGLPMAEAMSIGLPVIATNWSGNVDFMNAENSLLVDFNLIPVDDPYGVYKDKSVLWADPSIDDAASKMRTLVSNSLLKKTLSEKSRADINSTHSMDLIGAKMRSLLCNT